VKKLFLVLLALGLAACQRGPDEVFDKVLVDFGLREKPEGYVSGADTVVDRLQAVGDTEMKRMNQEARHGEIKFQEDGLRGLYYKEVKVYERCYPLDAQPVSASSQTDSRGYVGYIEYAYRVYQSPRKSNRAEATAESATISTDEQGRETYRYNFGPGGVWDGGKGERARK